MGNNKRIMYASYGILGHEKQPLYTLDRPAGDIYERFILRLPEGWSFGRNYMDETLIDTPDGMTYQAGQILTNWGDEPALVWHDGRTNRHLILKDCGRFEDLMELPFRDFLRELGLSQTECSRRFDIPLRTVQNWANDVNKCPGYTRRMIAEQVFNAK